jgi:hypothetical protein
VINITLAASFEDEASELPLDRYAAFTAHAGRLWAELEDLPRRDWRAIHTVTRLHPHRQLYATEWAPGQFATFTAHRPRGALHVVLRRIGTRTVLAAP